MTGGAKDSMGKKSQLQDTCGEKLNLQYISKVVFLWGFEPQKKKTNLKFQFNFTHKHFFYLFFHSFNELHFSHIVHMKHIEPLILSLSSQG